MPLKLALIAVPPVCVSCAVLYVAGVPWGVTGRIVAILSAFLLVTGLCDRLRLRGRRSARRRRLADSEMEPTEAAASSFAALPREPAAGLSLAVLAGLPVYKYDEKVQRGGGGGGGGDECAVCLGEMRPMEVVKRLPACAHLFHEGCIDVWLWSHRTCPVCRSAVDTNAAVRPAVPPEVAVRAQEEC